MVGVVGAAAGSADDEEEKKKAAIGMAEKYREMSKTERQRLTFGKSAIHGWGLFAREPMDAGTLVVEYKGDRVRNALSDKLEQYYEETNQDCYLLKVDEQWVVDATVSGNLARFTNHSCTPNMFIKVLKVDGEYRIIFVLRKRIAVGTELTYDYRFDTEESRVPCYCGASACRGFLC